MLQSPLHADLFEPAQYSPKLSKKEKRKLRKAPVADLVRPSNFGLNLLPISPKTNNQRTAFEAYYSDKHLAMLGVAGTGKTFLSMFFSCDDILNNKSLKKQIIIFRSAVQTRNLGFLGGKLSEKIKVYETPYSEICQSLFQRGDAYDILKQKQIISFESTSFLRGRTISNANIIIDEAQNMTSHELHSLVTRLGENCRLFVCGDVAQVDLETRKETSGLSDFIKIFKHMGAVCSVNFTVDDICRSGFVKDYYVARAKLEKQGEITKLIT